MATDGREVENYLSPRTITTVVGMDEQVREAMPTNLFRGIWSEIKEGLGEQFERNKVTSAEKAVGAMEVDDLNILNLNANLNKAMLEIQRWNRVAPN